MTASQFMSLAYLAFKRLQDFAPKDTGNLAYNSIKIEFKNDEAHIYVDQSIAPYMMYTNQPWISPKWKGRQNPNEHWFNDAAAYIAYQIASSTGGTIYRDRGESDDTINGYSQQA